MKICVTLVGVCRPTLDSVIQNIERNQSYFRTMYLRHTFTFIVLTYKNAFFEKLLDYCTRQGIDCIGLDAVDEKDFIFPVKIKIPNIYRMFYSMNSVMNAIPKNTYDGILRIRLDCEILAFQIHDIIEENTYYILQRDSNRVEDNLAYGSYNTMKQLWKHEHCLFKGLSTEEVLHTVIKKCKYKIKPFIYHYILHQSSDEMFDGVPQWSKRSREWIFDGTEYILNDI